MSHRTSVLALALVLGSSVAIGQSPATPPAPDPAARWIRAFDAWESGHYPAALEDLRALMQAPSATEYFERVALLTGELYTTTVLTTEGSIPRISANGSLASYQVSVNNQPVTKVIRLGQKPEAVAELPTGILAFDNGGRRVAWLRYVAAGNPTASEIVVRDLTTGQDAVWLGRGMQKSELAWSADDQSIMYLGTLPDVTDRSDAYRLRSGQTPEVLTSEPGRKAGLVFDSAGKTLAYRELAAAPAAGGGAGRAGGGGGAGGGRGGGGGAAPLTYGIVSLADKSTRKVSGSALTLSADGGTIAWLSREGTATTLNTAPTATAQTRTIRTTTVTQRLDAPALSPDGSLVAYQLMTNTDWDIYVTDTVGTHRRLTRDIQHDLLPRFLSNSTILAVMGEARHRRSHLYDVATGARTRLFANNTIRTISPEYSWTPSTDGRVLILAAERDGDTVSAERDVSIVDLTRKISVQDLLARLDRQLVEETDLRARMTKAFQPVAALTRQVLARASVNRVFAHEKALFDFDSKHITQPGNLKATEYLERAYRSFGLPTELQWFSPPALQQNGGKTANVVATLKGTENPNLIYVVSSHFDSVAAGPGADDDTSGTAALLEAARILAATPLPATVVFASFTGEEAGLLGSREFVRLAAVNKWNIIGALNNDMIGWAADSGRLDNTIRYSNAGIRDIQHGAAFLFTELVLFDAKYYKSTDAAAFYDGWGDIVGGIGSYPVLANPNYHQPTDFLETINHRQVLETAKVTAATLINLASSPSRLKDLKATRTSAGIGVSWTPSPEAGVKTYVVAYGPASNPLRTRVSVAAAKAALPALPADTQIAVKAVNGRGLEGWDWARVTVK